MALSRYFFITSGLVPATSPLRPFTAGATAFAPIVWLLWTAAGSIWLAKDIVREAHPGQSDVPAVIFLSFGIFCFQAVFTLGAAFLAFAML